MSRIPKSRHQDPATRGGSKSVHLLARRGDPTAARAVALVYRYADNPDHLVTALIDLVGKGPVRTQKLIIELILSTDPSANTIVKLLLGPYVGRSRAAARVLARISYGSKEAIPTLAPLLGANYDSEIAATAFKALSRIGDAALPALAVARRPSRADRFPVQSREMADFIRYQKSVIRHRDRILGGWRSLELPTEPPASLEASPEAPPEAPAEAPRYTDIEFFEGRVFPSDLAAATPMPDDAPLRPGKPYTMSVAIRAIRKGVGADQKPARDVRNPRSEREDIDIYVIVRPVIPVITVTQSLLKVTWPFDADSDAALFNLTVLDTAEPVQGDLEIRLYDKSLDLLDIVKISVVVAPGQEAAAPRRQISWSDRKAPLPRIDANAPQRLANIHVRKEVDGYQFEFILRDQAGDLLPIPVFRKITTGDLDALLVRVRNFWTRLVITNYSTQLSVAPSTYDRYLTDLRELGMKAWTTLFGIGRADWKGASETMGEFLKQTELPDGAIIQIGEGDQGTGFIFPWALLHPPTEEEDEIVDPSNFWGAKFRIEQIGDRPDENQLDAEPINMLFALDRSFVSSPAHEQEIAAFATTAKHKVNITGPISTKAELLAALKQIPAVHFAYFFCHGFTASANPGLRADGVQMLRKAIEAIAEGTAERKALDTLLDLTAQMNDDSWMFIGGAEVKEALLERQDFFEKRRPIVFLNMCHSADLLPSLSTGFVRVFLAHNAAAVIGTESPMTAVFASAFAEKILAALFDGDDVGLALWKARRHFLHADIRNPLGLAYTLYGRATARFG